MTRRSRACPIGLLFTALLALGGCDRAAAPARTDPPAAAGSSASMAGPVVAPAVAPPPPTPAEREAGAALATRGASGVPACVSCHGPSGEGNGAMKAPRIAGQSLDYLQHQLESFAGDTRRHSVMGPIATAMSEAQRRAAAAHYAAMAPGGTAKAAKQPAKAEGTGARLAQVGDAARGVQACANCHGVDGGGQGRAAPYLAGLDRDYLVAALAAWREGSRHNDASEQMPLLARALTDSDVQALAAYYAGLPLPGRARDADVAAPLVSTGRAVVSGPRGAAAAAAASATGTEQGATTSGGGQGPGGGGANRSGQ